MNGRKEMMKRKMEGKRLRKNSFQMQKRKENENDVMKCKKWRNKV